MVLHNVFDRSLEIGNYAVTGGRIRIPHEDLKRHWHILGRTGHGKTKALELFARHVIDSGSALVLLDGKGDCFDHVLNYCVEQGHEDRVAAIIDPTQRQWAVGINYLEALGGTEPSTLARWTTQGLKKVFKEGDDLKAWLEQWMPNTVLPLIKLGMTLLEVEEFTSPSDPTFRQAAWHTLGSDAELERKRWQDLVTLGPHEMGKQTGVVRTRGTLISNSDMARAMFGQPTTTINWRKVLDEGGIVLIRAHEDTLCDAQLADMIGVTVLHQIKQATFSRKDTPEPQRPDAWVIADEFQKFLSDDWKDAITQFRSFRVWLMLSCQELVQISEHIPTLAAEVLGECTGKLYFSLSHADAETTVHELFQDWLSRDHIKHIQTKISWWLKEEQRTVRSTSHAEGRVDSSHYMDMDSEGTVSGWANGMVQSFGPTGMFLGGDPSGTAAQQSLSGASMTGRGSGTGGGWSDSVVDSTSEAVVPFIKPYPFIEETGRQFYQSQDLVERAVYWLMKQDTRRAQLKVGHRKTIPIVTRFVRPAVVLPEEVEEFIELVMARCAMPFEEARALPGQRRREFLEGYQAALALDAHTERAAMSEGRTRAREEEDAQERADFTDPRQR